MASVEIEIALDGSREDAQQVAEALIAKLRELGLGEVTLVDIRPAGEPRADREVSAVPDREEVER